MREAVRFVGKVLGGTISRSADRWFMSITVEMPDPLVVHCENQAVVGVDLGVSAFATLSTGEKIVRPNAYAAAQKKLRRLSQRFSRQSAFRAGARPAPPERDAHTPVEEYAENPTPHRPTPCPDCPYPGGCVTPNDHRSGPSFRCHRHRGSECGGDAEQSSASRSHCRYGLWRLSPPVRI